MKLKFEDSPTVIYQKEAKSPYGTIIYDLSTKDVHLPNGVTHRCTYPIQAYLWAQEFICSRLIDDINNLLPTIDDALTEQTERYLKHLSHFQNKTSILIEEHQKQAQKLT